MAPEKIKVRTETGQTLEVVVYSKHAGSIQVVIGTGEHSMKCTLSPTRNEMAYVGSIMGREIVYERSRAQVQADIERLNPNVRPSRPR
jgi:K+/H+ antiporter YhaU regulatory subunit KhtT